MNHKQIFLKIGRAYEVPPGERTRRQTRLAYTGLCHACRAMGIGYNIPGSIRGCQIFSRAYWLPTIVNFRWNRDCDYIRADFCYLLAAMSKKEFEELI